MVLITVVVIVALLAMGLDTSQGTLEALGPQFLGGTSILQILGFGGVGVGLAWWDRTRALPPQQPPPPPAKVQGEVRQFLGIRTTTPVWLATAFLGGLTIWTFPSWCAMRLSEAFAYEGTLELIGGALASSSLAENWLLVLAIVVSAPLIEEVVFRGYLWSVFEQALPASYAFGATSALFAAYHMDPIHVVSLLPTALFLGWLRWQSGSVWPPIAAHFANNGIGVAITMAAAADEAISLTASTAMLGLGFSLLMAIAGWAWARRASSSGAMPR